MDKFTYLGSNVLSTENNNNTRLAKILTAIDWLSVIWKSDLSDKIKHNFFQAEVMSILLHRYITWILTKRMEKKLDGNFERMLRAILDKSWKQHPKKQQLYSHPLSFLKQSKLDEKDMQDTTVEGRTNSLRRSPIDPFVETSVGRPARTYLQ